MAEGQAGSEREYWPEPISKSNASRIMAAIPFMRSQDYQDSRQLPPTPGPLPQQAQRPLPIPPIPPDGRGQEVQRDPPQNLGRQIVQGYPADWVQPTGEGGGGGPPGSGMPVTPSPSPTNPPLISGNDPPVDPQTVTPPNAPALLSPAQQLLLGGAGAAAIPKLLGYGGPEQRRLPSPETSAAPQIETESPPRALTYDPHGLRGTRINPSAGSNTPTGETSPVIDIPAVPSSVLDKALAPGGPAQLQLPGPEILKPGFRSGDVRVGPGFLGELGRDLAKVGRKLRY